jgi:hypothetical protein
MNGEFPSNSKKPRPAQEPKKVESVIVNKAVSKKKPLGQRMKSLFFAGDSRTAVQSVIADVIIPQIKDMATEAAQQAIERFIFGESRTNSRRSGYRSSSSSPGYTNYGNRYSGRGNNPIGRATREERVPNAGLRREDIEDILLETRAEAQEVLERLGDLIENYERATVADLKALIDWSPEITDERWGWESLEGARVMSDRQGFVLDLPKPQPLD